MDTSAQANPQLRKATAERKQQPGHRCLGRQRDGNYALSVGVPTGCFNAEQLRSLANVIERYGKVGHLSTAQSVIIVGIPAADFYQAKLAVLDAGFEVRSVGRDVRQVKCCPGADFSPFGLQSTFPMAEELERTFRGLPTPVKFKISVSGCPNCCANTMLNDFGIHGMVDGWKIFAGGKMGTKPVIAQQIAESVASDDVAKYLAAVLRVYEDEAEPKERLAATLARVGLEQFTSKVEAALNTPYDDLAQAAQQAREDANACECIGRPD